MVKEVPRAIRENPLRTDIDLLLMDGKSYSFIAKWLKDQGHPVSRQTISTYHKEHMNVDKEASQQYQEIQAQEILREGVKQRMSDIDILDRIIQKMGEVNLDLVAEDKLVDLGLKALKHKKDILDAGDKDGEIAASLELIAAAIANRGDAKAVAGSGARRSFDDPSKDQSS